MVQETLYSSYGERVKMARPQEFNREDVIDKAIEVFWRKGFEATSVQDLVEATKLNRGSLYNAFGDKSGLFDAALERYAQHSPAKRLIRSAGDAAPRQTIEAIFNAVIERATTGNKGYGCLITNTATELAGRDKDIAARVGAGLKELEDAFFRLIERGQHDGDIAPWRAPRALARFLVAALQGLIVVGKVTPNREALRDIADTALSQLD